MLREKTTNAYTEKWMLPVLSFCMILLVIVISLLYYRTSTEQIYDTGTKEVFSTAAQLDNYLDSARGILSVTADTVDYMIQNDASQGEILAAIFLLQT